MSRHSQASLNAIALNYASPFQKKTLVFLLARGWNVNSVKQSPSRKSFAITVHGPSFGLVNPNGFFSVAPKHGKVSWSWTTLDNFAEATVPNYNGLAVE